jgi:hypothetical protein
MQIAWILGRFSSGVTLQNQPDGQDSGRTADIRVVVYDHSFKGDRAWFRFAFKWTDPKTGEPRSRAGMQSYRIEAGKLVDTWLMLQLLGSAWPDAIAQEHWTSPPPIK